MGSRCGQNGGGYEQERLALLETHRADVLARIDALRENLEAIDHKIDVYRGRFVAGDADRLWAPDPADLAAAQAGA